MLLKQEDQLKNSFNFMAKIKNNTMKNLVTGANGLVGSHTVFDLLLRGQQVIALTRSLKNREAINNLFQWYYPNKSDLINHVKWVEGDILDLSCMHEYISAVDHVYHCAGYVSFDRNDTKLLHEINVNGTANIVNTCLHFNKSLCFVSSIATTESDPEHEFITEVNTWKGKKGKSVYATSKYLAELEVWRGITEGLSAAIVNPSVILGPGDYSRSSGKLFERIYAGMRYYTPGITGYVDVRDVARIMVQLVENKVWGERFILNAENIGYQQLFKSISENLNVKVPNRLATYRQAMLAVKLEKFRSMITGAKPRITRSTVKAGFSKQCYSSEKIIDQLDIKFIPVVETVELVSKHFLETVV